jgi:hypothetical protein
MCPWIRLPRLTMARCVSHPDCVFISSNCNHVTDEPTHSNSSYVDNRYADRRGHGVLPPVLADKLTTGATLTHVTAEYMCGGRLCISKRRQQELVTKVVSYRGS